MLRKLRSLLLRTPSVGEAKARYFHRDGASVLLRVRSFEPDLRVGGRAQFKVSLLNDGIANCTPVRLVMRWKTKGADGGDVVVDEQLAAEVTSLSAGETYEIESSVPVPLRTVWDVDIEFHLKSLDASDWQSEEVPASLRRHVSGQSSEDAPADFDYEVFYRTVDLEKDWWTPVGPATRAEYETLGRGKCAQLVALGLNASSRVLDIGCGTGQLTEALVSILSPDGLYYGTELAEPAVKFCQARFPQSNLHFVKNEQTAIPIHGVEFDFIYLGSVFTHMFPADIAIMLGEIRRLMADTGCVVADAFVSPAIADYIGNRSMVQLNEGNLLAAFRRHGFNVRELSSMNWNEQCRRVIYHLTA